MWDCTRPSDKITGTSVELTDWGVLCLAGEEGGLLSGRETSESNFSNA